MNKPLSKKDVAEVRRFVNKYFETLDNIDKRIPDDKRKNLVSILKYATESEKEILGRYYSMYFMVTHKMILDIKDFRV